MKILLVNQFFWPDVAATGQFLTDLARHLAVHHEVTVICSGGAYGRTESDEDPPPVRIIRVPGSTYSRSVAARALSYSAFLAGALWHELRIERQDMIVTLTTPPLLSIGGALVKALRGTRHYSWEMDLFPDALVSLGALRERGVAHRVLGWIEDFSRRRSDGVIALGDCMKARLLARGIPDHLVHVAENWADGSVITPRPPRHDGPLHVLYSGNLGLSHDVETIAAAMRHFRNDPRFEFTFAGGGVKRSLLQEMCKAEGIGNAAFTPYCGRHQMGEHLAQADVGLVTEQPVCVGTVVPSKIYGLMAAGRPILFIGPSGATPELLIRKFGCGWSIDPGAGDQLISLLERLWSDRESVGMRGRRARQAFERHYDLPLGVERIAAILGAAPAPNTERAPEHFVTHC